MPKLIKTRILTVRHSNPKEYCVEAFTEHGRYAPADYYTNDEQDAIDTAKAMLRLPIKIGYNTWKGM